MGFIRKRPEKSKEKEKLIKAREAKIKEIISREYKLYKEEERLASLPRTFYEKACKFSEKSIKIKPDEKTGKKIEEAIKFSHLNITPEGVASLTILFALVTSVPTLILIILNIFGLPGISVGYGMIIMLLSMFFTYYLYTYPFHLKKRYEIDVGSEIVTMILYMAMYMRNVPNLEGALRFASENLTGPLGYELKKLMWDVEVGNYVNVQDALMDYTRKWSQNKELIESIELLITSLKQVGERRLSLLDEAVNIILEGNREQAKHFNQKLKMPVMVVHALGIILPVMGLVLFPVVAIFLRVEATILFVGYDILLPFILYFVITNILEIRPSTFSKIDITENPDVPPSGKFKFGKTFVRAWPFGLIAGTIVLSLGIIVSFNDEEGIISAILILFGIAFGFALYYILLSNQRLKVREKTRKIEGEFAEALFQLGNQIGGGTPIELSIEHSMERIKNLEIRNLFSRALNNMKSLGFTFSQAFFDKEYGAIRYYPSKMIKSIMHTVVESTKKGVSTAAVAMLSVSRYLKGLHQTQEDIKEQLNDTLNSLKFQLLFLSPLISGVIVTLAIIIMRILKQLSEQSTALSTGSLPFISQFGEANITPFQFLFVVGIYLIETCFILSMFINTIENGEDPIGWYNLTGYSLIIGFVVFSICLFATLTVFGPLISSTLTS
ncbi:MAG: type II secretion system F family protein [Candidatus Aenigmatarchaeota archaeon]